MAISSWGTGRKDYSRNVEESVVPIIRSYQVNAWATEEFTIAAGVTSTLTPTMTFSTGSSSHHISELFVTADANVLLGLDAKIVESDGDERSVWQGFGYQNIVVPIDVTWGVSEIRCYITNYSDISIKGAYGHVGVQGTEKIMAVSLPT